jgi:hypothetical protein
VLGTFIESHDQVRIPKFASDRACPTLRSSHQTCSRAFPSVTPCHLNQQQCTEASKLTSPSAADTCNCAA